MISVQRSHGNTPAGSLPSHGGFSKRTATSTSRGCRTLPLPLSISPSRLTNTIPPLLIDNHVASTVSSSAVLDPYPAPRRPCTTFKPTAFPSYSLPMAAASMSRNESRNLVTVSAFRSIPQCLSNRTHRLRSWSTGMQIKRRSGTSVSW